MEKLRYQKMWEAADTFLYDIDAGSVLPILRSLPKIASFADRHWFYYYENGIGAAYYEEGEMKKASESGLRDFSSKEYQESYFSKMKILLDFESKLYSEIEATDLSATSNDELKVLFNKAIDVVVENFGYFLACQPQCVSSIEKMIQEKLADIVPEHKIIEAFTLLSIPTTATKMKREEWDWLSLIRKTKIESLPQEKIDRLILEHYKQYFLLNAADGHEPWNFSYFNSKFLEDNSLSVSDIETKLTELTDSSRRIEDQKKSFIIEYKIPVSIQEYCNLLAEIGHWRFEMRFLWMAGQYYDKLILREVGKRFSYDEALIRFASIDEIIMLFEGQVLDEDLLKERSDSFMFGISDGEKVIYAGKKAKEKLSELTGTLDASTISEFRGNIAMKGKVTAVVLVYKWGEDMELKIRKFNEDYILVAGQTRPQLMPLIKRSKGIITDEGGITSHAAIVSRELRVPCIIGTKIATQVLQDGDLVEMDADNGVVRVLKRK